MYKRQDSLCAPLSLINALLVTIAMKRKCDAENIFTKLERLWDEYLSLIHI